MALLPMRVHHVHGPIPIDRSPDDLLAVTIVRNGAFYVRSFLDHHRRLGIAHFLVLDNGSTDGTFAFLCAQPDVTVVRDVVPYRTYENLMKRYMVRRHSTGKWNVFVDIDELFDYPASDRLDLRDFSPISTQHGYTAAIAQMLDIFPDGALADSPAESPTSSRPSLSSTSPASRSGRTSTTPTLLPQCSPTTAGSGSRCSAPRTCLRRPR